MVYYYSDDDAALAAERIERHLHSPPAGAYASAYSLLVEENSVGGTNMGCRLDLRAMLEAFPEVVIKKFTGLIVRVGVQIGAATVEATALCFEPGSIVIIGARNSEHMRLTMDTLADLLRACGHDVRMSYISLDNKVAGGALGFFVRLEMLHDQLPGFETVYEPLLFPGVVCLYIQPDGPPCTMVVFENGKVQVLGIDDVAVAQERFIVLCTLASQFAADGNTARQDNKSKERDMRNRNQQAGRLRGRGGGLKRGMKAAREISEYLAQNRHLAHDTRFHQQARERLTAIMAAEAAALAPDHAPSAAEQLRAERSRLRALLSDAPEDAAGPRKARRIAADDELLAHDI
jgi:TATA-box binding protein (TBP) (component of TFIID and TFIIIB)